MPIIAILRKLPDQKVARPFNRATNMDELNDMLTHYAHMESCGISFIDLSNINSDAPIIKVILKRDRGTAEFFAFTEE